jgi:hypothetical protein
VYAPQKRALLHFRDSPLTLAARSPERLLCAGIPRRQQGRALYCVMHSAVGMRCRMGIRAAGSAIRSWPTCSLHAARMHVVRRKWPRRASSRIGEPAHVRVPEDELLRPRAVHGAMHAPEQWDAPVQATIDARELLQRVRETVKP